ncbi:MAG: hypothetical protein M3619_22630, partial [Myxococcota bacterium]|nr:hypothetical protein [Myxococcota bacterium]
QDIRHRSEIPNEVAFLAPFFDLCRTPQPRGIRSPRERRYEPWRTEDRAERRDGDGFVVGSYG